jgi:tetratricopeptide (TPR) repeat protein
VLLVREGRTEEALAEALRGVQLDPGGAARRLSLSFDALGLGRGEVAVRAAEEALAMDSTLLLAQALQLRSLLAVGDIRRCTVVPAGPHLGTRAACLQAMGREEEAQALVDSLVQLAVTRDPADTVHSSVIYAQELAIYFAWTGEATSAAYWVREAFEMSPLGMDHRYLRSRLFDRVMRDRTFAETVGRLQGAVYPRVRREADRIGQELLARAAPDALRGAADLEIPRPLRR